MPKDLPGFYYDPEKNRYFPIKGPIPGSHAQRPPSKPDKTDDQPNKCRKKGFRTSELLQGRELHGKVLSFDKWRCNFQQEYQKLQASQPMIWKYERADMVADSSLEQLRVELQTPEGQNEANVLLMGSMNGSLSLFEIGKDGHHFDYGIKCMPDRIWPLISGSQTEGNNVPGHIWRPPGASALLSSNISCIKRIQKHSHSMLDDGADIQQALIVTLGSETSGGSIYILNLNEPLDFNPSVPVLRSKIREVLSMNCTIWTADCNSSGSEAVIGTNLGATLINLETGALTCLCRSKSDVLCQQFDQSGNNVLCGFRNGAIVTVDVRQRGFSSSLPRHRISQNLSKQWFKIKGNIKPSYTTSMSSSISSLVSLQSYDQYFLASSMDGLIKLYDHRLIQRGPVQSYEGNVNSHTRIQLGVDPSEGLVISGGEDGKVRIWSIKTAELLFQSKISTAVPSVVCWPGTRELQGSPEGRSNYEENQSRNSHSWGAWLGSKEGVFYMHDS